MNYPKRITETLETLKMIEEAVTEDTVALTHPKRELDDAYIEALRARVHNAVLIFCAAMNSGV
jgi:hypothetical protein